MKFYVHWYRLNCEIYVFTLFLNCVFYFLLIFFAVCKICVQTHDIFFLIFLVCLIFNMKHFVYEFFRVFSHKKTQQKNISCSSYCLFIPNNSCDLYYVNFFFFIVRGFMWG